jgi:hypothetical protein
VADLLVHFFELFGLVRPVLGGVGGVLNRVEPCCTYECVTSYERVSHVCVYLYENVTSYEGGMPHM